MKPTPNKPQKTAEEIGLAYFPPDFEYTKRPKGAVKMDENAPRRGFAVQLIQYMIEDGWIRIADPDEPVKTFWERDGGRK